jgi:putative FmdB family regulatory protein
MPIYEYICQKCFYVTEVLQRMGEGPEGVSCKRCGSTDLKRRPSIFACHDGNKDWYHEEYVELKAEDQQQIDKEKVETRLKHKEWERNKKEKKRAAETKRTYSIKE